MTNKEIETHVLFINDELKNIELEKLFKITCKQWGKSKNQTIWWYWRCQYDHFDNHSNDWMLK